MGTEEDYSSSTLTVAGLTLLVLASCSYLAVRCITIGGKPKRYPPVVGTMFHQLYHVRRLHEYHADLFRRRKTFRLLAPGRRLVNTCDPAVVEHILRTNFANYGKGPFNYENTRDLLGDGIFAVDGDKWSQQRKIASYEFSTRAMRDFSSAVFRKNAAKLAAIVSSNAASKQPMEFQGLLQKAAMDSTFTVTFGSELNALEAGSDDEAIRFTAAVDDANEFTLLRYVNAFWKVTRFLNVGSEAALKKRIEVIDEFVHKRIRARSEELKMQQDPADSRQDILSRFMEATIIDDDSGTVDYKYLRDIILNIVVAGRDTTVSALAWFFYMVCKHPGVQERICQEAGEATGAGEAASVEEFARSLTDEALNKMHYLHAAFTETLRLYPALPLNNKQCFSDDVLPDGLNVGKGDIVFYVPYAMGRMEYLWGKDAEVFRPERWLDGNGEFQQENPFKFTAFQAGPRICLGKEFAYRQMKIVAAVLLRFFVFSLRDERASVRYRATITLLIEQGLHLMATAR